MPRSVLVSQIGYRPEDPKIAVIRAGADDEPPATATLVPFEDRAAVAEYPVVHTGQLWGINFWTVDFTASVTPGRYVVRLPDGETSNEFDIEEDVLLHRTLVATSVGMLETRVRGKLGWQDCAFDGRGLESHAIVVLGLVDVLTLVPQLDAATRHRLEAQLRHGTEYLAACQRDDGSFANEYYIARDRTTWTLCALGCVALVRAAEQLSSGPLLDRAKAAWRWCVAHDSSDERGNDLETTRRIFGQYPPWTPPRTPRSRDVLLMLHAATELYRNTNDLTYLDRARELARTLHANYQCREPSAAHGLYGDFLAWPGTGVHQRAWEHAGWGFHCGSVLPDDVSGLLNLIELSPADPDEPLWRAVVHAYAYGYLLPACALTPFGIYPLGDCEGEARFFGPSWHGFNGMYGQVARTCMRLARHFGDPRFERAAQGNLQWIAGANVGTEIAGGRYQGVSWISGIGAQSVEVWSSNPGSIGNGFCANRQFRLQHLDDLDDAPRFRTHEDWLVHNGSWLSGLAEVSTRPRVKVKIQNAGRAAPAEVSLALGDLTLEASTNVRGVVVFDELPRLRHGTLAVTAETRHLELPVQPVSGASLDLVVDLAETLLVEWDVSQAPPRAMITNRGSQHATAQVEFTALTDVLTSTSQTCELPAGETTVRELPGDLGLPGNGICWLRVVVTGQYSVAAAETTYDREQLG